MLHLAMLWHQHQPSRPAGVSAAAARRDGLV
jgi:hypothetical protein